MKALCFEENDKLDQTEYTQAALVTVCLAMEHVLRERGLKADVTAGLSWESTVPSHLRAE